MKFLVEIGQMVHDISHLYVQWCDTRRMVMFCLDTWHFQRFLATGS